MFSKGVSLKGYLIHNRCRLHTAPLIACIRKQKKIPSWSRRGIVQPRRYFRGDARMKRQFKYLFDACNTQSLDGVTMDELRRTLFRFGLDKLEDKDMERIFHEADTDSQGALNFDQFVTFVVDAVEFKTKWELVQPSNKSPTTFRLVINELRQLKISFSLLFQQTMTAGALCMDHVRYGGIREISRGERQLLFIVFADFVKILPFAAVLALPGGGVIAGLVSKYVPHLMPTTFLQASDGTPTDREKMALSSLTVASRILSLERILLESRNARQTGENVGQDTMPLPTAKNHLNRQGDYHKLECMYDGPTINVAQSSSTEAITTAATNITTADSDASVDKENTADRACSDHGISDEARHSQSGAPTDT